MPELPEVETTRRGLLPHVAGRSVEHVLLRRPDLRWPIPREVERGMQQGLGGGPRHAGRRGGAEALDHEVGHCLPSSSASASSSSSISGLTG